MRGICSICGKEINNIDHIVCEMDPNQQYLDYDEELIE